MKLQTAKRIAKMNKYISILIAGILIAIAILFVLGADNIHLKKEIDSLQKDNNRLNKEVKVLYTKLDSVYIKIDSVSSSRKRIRVEVDSMKNSLMIREQQLSLIKGRYKTLTSDSLRKLAIRKYEMDSIKSITNK